jgi:hypothetical protein
MSDRSKRDWLSDAVVLFSVPTLAYLLVYLWELSYCVVFDIP